MTADSNRDLKGIGRSGVGAHPVTQSRVRLRTLIAVRWVAIGGQLTTILLVAVVLQFPFNIGWALALVAASVLFNIYLGTRYPGNHHLDDSAAALHMAYDLAQLGGLLYLTGGLTNPFAILLLGPVTISGTILSRRSTSLLLSFALGISLALLRFHEPLPWAGEEILLSDLYLWGLWAGLAIAMIFLALYAARVASEANRRREALSATQLALAQEQRLAALGTLAAAAAHELGTPLGTIAIAAREMMNPDISARDLRQDAQTISEQAERCRLILRELAETYAEDRPHHLDDLPVEALLEEAAGPLRAIHSRDVALEFRRSPEPGATPLHIGNRPEIVHGLRNFIDNALRYARTKVIVEAAWSDSALRIRIMDDGPGFPLSLRSRLGEPYLTFGASQEDDAEPSRPHDGLGLGIFIAKTLLERTGAKVEFDNQTHGGAAVMVEWPRPLPEKAKTFRSMRTTS